MRRIFALVGAIVLVAAPAFAQDTTCPEYRGLVCDGWVTDDAGVLVDEDAVERAAQRFVLQHGHEIAVVVVPDADGLDPRTFAEELGNTWGVGDPTLNDGIVLLVALAERRTEIVTGPGLPLGGLDSVAASGNGYFADGDFDGGLIAIITSLGLTIEGGSAPPDYPPPSDDGDGFFPAIPIGRILTTGLLALVGVTMVRNARSRTRRRILAARSRKVDAALSHLEPDGADLPRLEDYALAASAGLADSTVGDGVTALRAVSDDRVGADEAALGALWRGGAIAIVDRDRLLADAAVPLELRASQEERMLEDAVQAQAREILEIPANEPDRFQVGLDELGRLVSALRPHRLASARRRGAEQIADSLSETPIGWAGVTDLGTRFLETAPALDASGPLASALVEVETAFAAATVKAERLSTIHGRLPDSTARPAVAAALADVDDDPDTALVAYERVQSRLERREAELEADGLEPSAIAALLLLNRDDDNVDEFLDTYRERRDDGMEPAAAVEHALAGLRDPDELDRVTEISKRLTLPVSIAAALVRRRDDGVEVYEGLLDELTEHDIEKLETRRTIAGVLAVSLEPAQAIRRWKEARTALESLGLVGAYADVAAAFGASDARGPRGFAIAYAATRQALARSDVDDADRFAPELAHEGTRPDRDSWTGAPVPVTYGSFDPFTFFYYHWVITRGADGSYGWEPIHRDDSWGSNRSSWWSGGGGFGSSGSSWGGSSWGSSSSGGGFGGFSGGGGFGGGGGGSSGGSGW